MAAPAGNSPGPAGRAPPWIWAPLVVALLGLAVLIVRDGVASWALETRPGSALAFAPGDSRALTGAADDRLQGARTGADFAAAERLARLAVARGPIQTDALRDLGFIAAARGDIPTANRRLSLAGARNPLDGATQLWLLKYRLITGDYAGAFKTADALFRHQPQLVTPLTPLLLAYVGPGSAALASRLATNPPWRAAFLAAMSAKISDPAATFALLSALQRTPAGPTEAETAAYLDRLVADGAYQNAYLDWLQLLPPSALAKATAVYDGDFTGLPGAPPFNWAFGSGIGGDAAPDTAPGSASGGGSALHVRYDGYSTPNLASQLLALAPGTYDLKGLARSSGETPVALAWTIGCADTPALTLARSETPAGSGSWQGFHTRFVVPAVGCAGQWLRLTPLPGGHERDVEVWYRGLVISPA